MINRLQLLRNIGLFDSVGSAATIPLARLTLIYAENGRGKTTLAAVLRSLATGDPMPITERRRLAAQHPPHVVLDCDGGPPSAMFENGAWNRTLSNLVVFDDVFVDQNVYSGLAVDAEHRQNLHELVLGAQGVTLSRQLQQLVARIEQHNRELRTRAAAIPEVERGGLSVDGFCALATRPNIDKEIQDTERALAAAREQDPVRNTALFDTLDLPAFDIATIDRILGEDLPALDAAAAARVQAHVATLGAGGEEWIGEGMRRVQQPAPDASTGSCPFCALDLAASPVIAHYRAYFSEDYADLKRRIDEALAGVNSTHAGDVLAGFERAVRVAGERRQFWSRFCDAPEVAIDTAAIVRDWRAAREGVGAALAAKQSTPLEAMALPHDTRNAVAAYEVHRRRIADLSDALITSNDTIRVVKEQAAAANAHVIATDLARLRATKGRHTADIAASCNDYLAEKAAKTQTEEERDRARAELDDHRSLTTVQETRRLAERAGQVMVLSHNKPFLCRIWEGADPSSRTALEVVRDGEGSTIRPWDVGQDSVTEHDRRHAMLRAYLADGTPNNREVARAIRPVLESFLRVSCPEHFPPGTLLGLFHRQCADRVGTNREILDAETTQELRDLKEYANRFHHDTNPAWETEAINDGELRHFVERTLSFARR